jgi:hypothetical protein
MLVCGTQSRVLLNRSRTNQQKSFSGCLLGFGLCPLSVILKNTLILELGLLDPHLYEPG